MRYVNSWILKAVLGLAFLFSSDLKSQNVQNFDEFLITIDKFNTAVDAYKKGGTQSFISALSTDLKIYDTLDLSKILKRKMEIPQLMFSGQDLLFVFNENNILRSPLYSATKGVLYINEKKLAYNFKYSILFNFINFRKVAPQDSNVLIAFSTFCSLYERVMSNSSAPIFAQEEIAPVREIASIPEAPLSENEAQNAFVYPEEITGQTVATKDAILDAPEFSDLFDNSRPENDILWIPAVFKLKGKQRKEFLETLYQASSPLESNTIGNIIKNFYSDSARNKLKKDFALQLSERNPHKSRYLATLGKVLEQSELFLITPRFAYEHSSNNFRPTWVFALTRQGIKNLEDFQQKFDSEKKIISLAKNILDKDNKMLVSYSFGETNRRPKAQKMQFLNVREVAHAFAVAYNKMP